MAFPLPPWLSVQPALFTQALEAGARAGLAVSEQQQRAFALAEARAERAARDAERQREFEETRLLNVQRLGQDAARLQQQVAHQTAQEAAQQAQESRLLDYNTGQLAVANRRAALDEQQFKAPTVFVPGTNGAPPYVRDPRGNPHFLPESATPNAALDTTLLEAIDPATKQRVGLFSRSGPRTQHFISDEREKEITPATRATIYNAEERGILKELDSLDMLAAARDPKNPKRARYDALNTELDAVRHRRSALGGSATAPTVMTNAATTLSAPSAATGRINPLPKDKSDLVEGSFYDIRGTVYRWDGANFKRVPTR